MPITFHEPFYKSIHLNEEDAKIINATLKEALEFIQGDPFTLLELAQRDSILVDNLEYVFELMNK